VARANEPPVIIKRVNKGHGHGHHGGGWKIAYADFATAMMAFFLLMWLLNATTEEQKLGISNYFMPTPFLKNDMVGSQGISGGQSPQDAGVLEQSPRSRPEVALSTSPRPEQERAGLSEEALQAELEEELARAEEEERQQRLERAQQAELQAVTAELQEAIAVDPELADLGQNLLVDRTSEGVRVQIVDHERRSMFPLGQAVLQPYTAALLARLATIIARTGRQISVTGHTDALPFRARSVQDNWQLSSDRANASRQALVAAGLPEARIARMVGKAATEPLDPADPDAPQNRRISIVLLREPAAIAPGTTPAGRY
jgi:chemotaxis protein MotB